MAQLCPNPDCSYTATPIVAFGCVLRGVGVAICTRTWKGTQSEHLILDCWAFMNDADRCGKGQLSRRRAYRLSIIGWLPSRPTHARAEPQAICGRAHPHHIRPCHGCLIKCLQVREPDSTAYKAILGHLQEWMQDARPNQCRRPSHRFCVTLGKATQWLKTRRTPTRRIPMSPIDH